jgi:hypothetical protein
MPALVFLGHHDYQLATQCHAHVFPEQGSPDGQGCSQLQSHHAKRRKYRGRGKARSFIIVIKPQLPKKETNVFMFFSKLTQQ